MGKGVDNKGLEWFVLLWARGGCVCVYHSLKAHLRVASWQTGEMPYCPQNRSRIISGRVFFFFSDGTAKLPGLSCFSRPHARPSTCPHALSTCPTPSPPGYGRWWIKLFSPQIYPRHHGMLRNIVQVWKFLIKKNQSQIILSCVCVCVCVMCFNLVHYSSWYFALALLPLKAPLLRRPPL